MIPLALPEQRRDTQDQNWEHSKAVDGDKGPSDSFFPPRGVSWDIMSRCICLQILKLVLAFLGFLVGCASRDLLARLGMIFSREPSRARKFRYQTPSSSLRAQRQVSPMKNLTHTQSYDQ